MGLRNYLRKIGMRKGNASRSKGRIGSNANKRAAAKAVRHQKTACEAHLTQITTDTIKQEWQMAMDSAWQEKLDELFNEQLTVNFAADFDLLTDEEPH